jgi:hypothetical protein
MNTMKPLSVGCILAATAIGVFGASAEEKNDADPRPAAPVAQSVVRHRVYTCMAG